MYFFGRADVEIHPGNYKKIEGLTMSFLLVTRHLYGIYQIKSCSLSDIFRMVLMSNRREDISYSISFFLIFVSLKKS